MPSAYKRRGRPPKPFTGRYCVLNAGCPINRYESDKCICCHDCPEHEDCEFACMNAPERCNCWTYKLPMAADAFYKWEEKHRRAI